MISSVEHIDAGTYTCKAKNSEGTNQVKVSLSVLSIPIVRVNPMEVTTLENSDAELECLIENLLTSDPYSLEWFNDAGKKISEVIL